MHDSTPAGVSPVPPALLVMTILGFTGAGVSALGAAASLFRDGVGLTTAWGSTDSALMMSLLAGGLAATSGLTFWRDRRSWAVLMSACVVLVIVGLLTGKIAAVAAVLPELIVLVLPSTRGHFRVRGA